MDILTTVGFAITGFVLVLFVVFMIGLKTKVQDAETLLETELITFERWTENIPELMIKHYESIYETKGMPVIKTVMLKGKAKYKISNLWMPVIYRTWVEQGTGYLRELDFYWYGKIILKGVDFWIKGVGALQVNGVIRMNETGKYVTESQLTSFLAESLLFGTFGFSQELIKWDTVDRNLISLTILSEGDEIKFHVDFDDKTGRIKKISSQRYRGQLEKKRISWRIVVKNWEKTRGRWVPAYYAKWDDQKRPWCHYQITGMAINANSKAVNDRIDKIITSKYKNETMVSKKKIKPNRVG